MDYDDIKSKATYSAEEKQAIMDMLNKERKAKEEQKSLKNNKPSIKEEDKQKIIDSINRQRRDEQLFEQMDKQRIANKKIYTIHNKKFYKIKNLERDYFFKVDDYEKLSSRPRIITIYHDFLGELKKKDVLIQIRRYSDKIFVSDDLIKVYYKTCYFEGKWCR